LGLIPKLLNLDFSQKEIEAQVANHSGIVAKSYLAAKETSVAEILNFSSETAETLIDLMKDRAELLDRKNAIAIYQSMIDKANDEKNRIVSIMKEFNLQSRNDPATFDFLKQNYESQDNLIKRSTESKEQQESILKPLHLKFARKCLSEHSRLLSLLPPMTIALRDELDNDGNSEAFVNALSENIQRMNAAYDKMFPNNPA
jgi:hypothetical protein